MLLESKVTWLTLEKALCPPETQQHNVRVQHGSPVRTKMGTGRILLNLMNYKSLGLVRTSCENINNNLFLGFVALLFIVINNKRAPYI
jgi:hypothetical protein